MHTNYMLADLDVLNIMAEDTSREVMPAMIQVYCDELSMRRDRLNAAKTNSDIGEIGEQAHAIKSSSGTFGAQRLRECAKILEATAGESACDPAKIDKLVEDVLLVLTDTIAEYHQCMGKF